MEPGELGSSTWRSIGREEEPTNQKSVRSLSVVEKRKI